MNFAWLIEHCDSESSRPRYFTGRVHPEFFWQDDPLMWSLPGDHADALRFARREDAERLAQWLDPVLKHRVVEHGWVGPEANPETAKCAPASWRTCGNVPPTQGYAACTRPTGHDGPCAHDHAPAVR